MTYITKLLIMWCFGLCLAGNSISIIQNSTTWNEAFGQCVVQKSRLADFAEIKTDQTCNMMSKSNRNKLFWTGNFYKLSTRISIEGCYNIITEQTEGHFSLHDCFELCTERMVKSVLFAHKGIFRENCICGQNFNNSLPKNLKPNFCSNTEHLQFWWVYKVHFNEFKTGSETCHQPACTYSDLKYDNVCGQISGTMKSNLKRPIPQDKLPYICESNEIKRASDNETVFTGNFRFGFNASVKNDNMDKPAVAFKCKALSCDSDNTYHISLQNCNSITFGYLCVTNNSHETKNSSQTNEPESTGAYATTRKITSQSNVQQQTSDVLFHSSQDNVDNRPVIYTHSTQSSVEGISQTTRPHSTPSMVNRSSYVSGNATGQNFYTTSSKITTQQRTSDVLSHSSRDNVNNGQVVATSPVRTGTTKKSETIWQQKVTSYIHSNTTVLKEREMLESTTRVPEIPSGSHSRIGLILGSLVAAVVVIVVVVLLVICRLRHHRPFMKNRFVDDSQINDSNFQDIDDTSNQSPPHVHNTMYDIHTVSGDDTRFGLLDVTNDSSNNIRKNEYAVVIKNNQSGNQVVEHNCDMNGGNSNDLVENEYNRVNDERPRNGNISSNSRNDEYAFVVKKNQSSNQEVEQNCSTNGENSDDILESEYDKLNHVRPRSDKGSNNLYDSALGFRDDYDATYNTTDYKRIDKRDDSVYDHT